MHRQIHTPQTNRKMFNRGSSNSPSIGSAEVMLDRYSKRVKGIIPELITRTNRLIDVLDGARNKASENGMGRVSLRFFFPSFPQMHKTPEGRELAAFLLSFNGIAGEFTNIFEARVPFNSGGRNCMLAYLGMNTQERLSPRRILLHEITMARLAGDGIRPSTPNSDYSIRAAELGDIPQLVELYRVFTKYLIPLNEENIRKMVETTPTLVAVSGGRVAAALAAEHVTFPVEGLGSVDLVEISEAATAQEHRGNRLFSTMTGMFVETALGDLEADSSIIYTETRAAHPAPTRGALIAGGTYGGLLNKHCIIESDRLVQEQGSFENLNVVHF
ncbi:MAG: GNAT family N-acetyltransferase [bacterium]|nr:GNAT family N-acetyltransferase [bacterium]